MSHTHTHEVHSPDVHYHLSLNNYSPPSWEIYIDGSVVETGTSLPTITDLLALFIAHGFSESKEVPFGRGGRGHRTVHCACKTKSAKNAARHVFHQLVENKFKP